jgi:hypothetical protein
MESMRVLSVAAALIVGLACVPRKSSQRAQPPKDEEQGNFGGYGGKPTKLISEQDAVYAQAGACVMLSVSVMDADSIDVSVEKDTTVNLSASPANVAFFSDPSCGEAAKTVALAKGDSIGAAFVTAPASGTTKITFSDAAQDGLQAATTAINAVLVTQLGASGAGVPLAVDECAPQGVIAQDGEGHPVVLAKDSTITASTSSPTGKFYSDDECTIESSTVQLRSGESQSESIYYKDKSPGTPSLTFSDSSNAGWKKAAISVTVSKDAAATP